MYEMVLYTLTLGVFDKSIAEAAKKAETQKVYLKLSGLKVDERGTAIWVYVKTNNGDRHCVALLSHTNNCKNKFYIDVTDKIKIKDVFGITIESKEKLSLKKWKLTTKKKS